jgi:chemotaxis response regulator CheB
MNSEQQINVSEAYTLELLQTGYVLIIKQHQQYSESRSTCTEEKNTSVVNIRK